MLGIFDGNIGYVYAVRHISPDKMTGIPVASFRVRSESYRRAS